MVFHVLLKVSDVLSFVLLSGAEAFVLDAFLLDALDDLGPVEVAFVAAATAVAFIGVLLMLMWLWESAMRWSIVNVDE